MRANGVQLLDTPRKRVRNARCEKFQQLCWVFLGLETMAL